MPDLQVASTTDSQEQVNQAAGVTEEIKKAGNTQIENEEKEEAPEIPQKEAAKPPEKEKPEVSPKLLKRIDKLTAQNAELAKQVQELKEKKPEAAKAEENPEAKGEEVSDKFPRYEEWADKQLAAGKKAELDDWIDARDDWKESKREQQEAQEAEQAHAREVMDGYNERVAEFKKEHDDWDEVIGNEKIVIHPGVQVAILEMENGPEVAYAIGKNPELAKKLFEMSEPRAIVEIGKIAAQFEKEQTGLPENTKIKTGPDKLPVSNAPAPVKQLTGHSTRSAVPPDEMDYAEYRKWRDKQEKERYRR